MPSRILPADFRHRWLAVSIGSAFAVVVLAVSLPGQTAFRASARCRRRWRGHNSPTIHGGDAQVRRCGRTSHRGHRRLSDDGADLGRCNHNGAAVTRAQPGLASALTPT
jgi:hypothetical protein